MTTIASKSKHKEIEPGQEHCAAAEAKFDKRVYGGISYWAQAITGIILTNKIRHGSWRPAFDKMANWLGPNFIEKVSSKRGAEAVKSADAWIVVSTMIMCGNAFIFPVKWLENRKPEIVRWMTERSNKAREAKGDHISADERHAQQDYLTALENEPKQSWLSLWGGRAFGLTGVYSTLWALNRVNGNKRMEDTFTHAVQESASAVGLKSVAESKAVEDYTRIAFYDLFYSTISAGGLYVYSHAISPWLHPMVAKAFGKTQETMPSHEEEKVSPVPMIADTAPENVSNRKWRVDNAHKKHSHTPATIGTAANHTERALSEPDLQGVHI